MASGENSAPLRYVAALPIVGHEMQQTDFTTVATVTLKKGRDWSVKKKHPWIFSGAIHRVEGKPAEGDIVSVKGPDGEPLGSGFFGTGSIAVRLLTYGSERLSQESFERRLDDAFALRRALGLVDSAQTNAFRLINAEGDFLPGLTVDLYDDTAVLQCHSLGMYRYRTTIARRLECLLGGRLRRVLDRSASALEKNAPGQSVQNEWLRGEPGEALILENGHTFAVDCAEGQKTGFFLDQRENRQALSQYCAGKRVLNAFSYTGGFSVYALKAGARSVDSVDVSKRALQWVDRNVQLNGAQERHTSIAADCFDFLRTIDGKYDVVVLDPPAFAKHRGAAEGAVRGYRSINAEALRRICSNGILFTFSCSQHIDRELFEDAVRHAAHESGREVRVLSSLGAGACHPQQMQHLEGRYLKGLVLYVGK